jgi:hypothetical protein
VTLAAQLAGAWETVGQPFNGWVGERWEFDPDGTGRVISAGILVSAGIVEFAWAAADAGRIRIRLAGDQWREVSVVLTADDSGERLTEEGADGFCGSDGPLCRAGAWPEQ